MDVNRIALSDECASQLLKVLFADLHEELSSERGRRRLIERYGADACVRLWEIVHALIGVPPPAPPSHLHANPGSVGGKGLASWIRS